MTGVAASANPAPGRRRRTPVVLQNELAECGVACLRSILGYHGRWVSMARLRDASGTGRDGCSAADLLRAARRYGLKASGWKQSANQAREVPFPVILHWGFNHFVVLEGAGRGRYYLNDPARGRRIVDEEEFIRGYSGTLLRFEKAPGFRPGTPPRGVLYSLWLRLRDFKPTLVLLGLLGLMLALATLAIPLSLIVLVDWILAGSQVGWGGTLAAAMAGVGIATYLLTWIQMRTLRRLSTAIAVTWSERIITHLFRLPTEFFGRRMSGDLLTRVQFIDVAARHGIAQLMHVTVDASMCLVFLAAMIVLDSRLAFLLLALGVACVLSTWLVGRLRDNFSHRLRRQRGLLAGVTIAGLRFMQAMRATAGEGSFFSRWVGCQARELQARQPSEELGQTAGALPGLFVILGAAPPSRRSTPPASYARATPCQRHCPRRHNAPEPILRPNRWCTLAPEPARFRRIRWTGRYAEVAAAVARLEVRQPILASQIQ